MGIKLLYTMSELQKQLENFRLICSKDNIDLKDVFIFSDILKYYFINDRPQVFSNYLIKSPSFFSKLLKASPFVTGTKIASDYFLFYYTLTKEDYFEVQNEKVQNYKEFIESEQTKALDLISWLKQPTTEALWPVPNIPGMPRLVDDNILSKAPSLGQHTKEILKSLGYTYSQIENLISEGVIR